MNNLQKELNEALEKQKKDSKFIIPLILEGDRESSIPKQLPDILSLDFTNPSDYCTRMVSLSPKGLIPMLLGIENSIVYETLVKGYHAQVKSVQQNSDKI